MQTVKFFEEKAELHEKKERCNICFEEIKEKGKLECCAHLFCATCVFTWSKIENTCPVCKKPFNTISRIGYHVVEENIKVAGVKQAKYKPRPHKVPFHESLHYNNKGIFGRVHEVRQTLKRNLGFKIDKENQG